MGVVQDRVHVPAIVPANECVVRKIFAGPRISASSFSISLMLPGERTAYS
jgi:hypothetical protein